MTRIARMRRSPGVASAQSASSAAGIPPSSCTSAHITSERFSNFLQRVILISRHVGTDLTIYFSTPQRPGRAERFGRAPSSDSGHLNPLYGAVWSRICVTPLLSDFKNLSKEYCIGLGYGESIAAPSSIDTFSMLAPLSQMTRFIARGNATVR